MKVLLVQPPMRSKIGLHTYILAEPLGLETVAASLVDEHEVQIIDLRLEPNLEAKLSSFKPDAVGVNAAFTSTVYAGFEILDKAKEYNPAIFTFVGGNHAALYNQDFAGRADAVVIGEGEVTAREVLRLREHNQPIDEVEGIAYPSKQGWKENKLRPQITNLDEMPLPARHLVAKYQEHYFQGSWKPCSQVETSRGCPFHCKFCAVWKFHRGACRMRSPQRVIRELLQVSTPYIFFADDNFLISPPRAHEICQGIREAGIKKEYQIQARSDTIVKHPELLKEWGEIGLRTVFIGFESFTEEGLEALDKHNSLQSNEEAIRVLKGLGIGIMSSFIVDPGYTQQEFTAMKKYIQEKSPPMPVFWILTPLPGTVLHEERHKEIITRNYDMYDGFHTVLPPRLGLEKFYEQYFSLWKSVYFRRLLPVLLARKTAGGSPVAFIKKMVKSIMMFREFNPRSLHMHHRQPPWKIPQAKKNVGPVGKRDSETALR